MKQVYGIFAQSSNGNNSLIDSIGLFEDEEDTKNRCDAMNENSRMNGMLSVYSKDIYSYKAIKINQREKK